MDSIWLLWLIRLRLWLLSTRLLDWSPEPLTACSWFVDFCTSSNTVFRFLSKPNRLPNHGYAFVHVTPGQTCR